MKIKNLLFFFLIGLLFFSFTIQNTDKNILSESSISDEKKPKPSATISTIATKDAYVDSDDPTSNFGGLDWAYVGWWFGDSMEAYFYFPFTNKPSNYIKAEIQIDVWGVSKTTPCNACIIEDTTWGEYTINWLNKPTRGQNIKAENDGLITGDGYYLIDVTDYVSSRNNISISIYCRDPLLDDWIYISTREADMGWSWYGEDNPKLIWTYPVVVSASGDDDDDDDDDKEKELLESISGYDTLIMSGCILGIVAILIKKLKCKTFQIFFFNFFSLIIFLSRRFILAFTIIL